MKNTPITIAYGDGIGPEIMDATLSILKEAGAKLDLEKIDIGEKVYLKGNSSGIEPTAWDSLRKTKVFLKAPITTPQGSGYKSLNVTTRKTLGLYANVRPCASYYPYVDTKYPNMDVVIIRENEEDLYAGIEHQQTIDVVQCLKLITRPGTERIVRFAFEYARINNRKKVTCFSKDNIMKMTDGLFHKIFNKIGEEYPSIEKEHWIIDIGTAKLADTPELFDVIVTENLYGDIISDVAAQIAGSVGLAGSSNIGANYAMFEAIHGSAPTIAGQNKANPSGLLLASVMMLLHIRQPEVAEKIHNAWLKTIEDGIHTADIFEKSKSLKLVGTKEFTLEVVKRLGKKPEKLHPISYNKEAAKEQHEAPAYIRPIVNRELRGVDVFIHSTDHPEKLGKAIKECSKHGLDLTIITTRGMKVWPEYHEETFLGDHYQCRFLSNKNIKVEDVINLLERINNSKYEIIKTEHLFYFDGTPAFTKGQGE